MFASMAEQRRYAHNVLTRNDVLVLSVYTRENIIMRDIPNVKTIYGTWDAVIKDINLDYFKHILIKVY